MNAPVFFKRFKRCQSPLLIAFGTMPVAVLAGCMLATGGLLPFLLLHALFALLACLCTLLPGKWRLAAGIAGCFGILSTGLWLITPVHWAGRLLLPIAYAILFLYLLPLRGEDLPVGWPMVCALLHLFAQFFLSVQNMPGRELLFEAASAPLYVSFVLFFTLWLFSMNRQSLQSSMPESSDVPGSIRRRNRLLTWILLGVVILISLIPALNQALSALWAWIKATIAALLEKLNQPWAESAAGVSQSGGGDMFGGLEAAEPSAFALFMEKVMFVIAYLLVAAAVIVVLRMLWKRLKKLVRYLYAQLRHYAAAAGEDYVDEVEDTREQGEERFHYAKNLLRRHRAVKGLKDLPPREQIRTRYGILRGRHPEWEKSQTARETLNTEGAELYERARYSSRDLTEKDAENFARQSERA